VCAGPSGVVTSPDQYLHNHLRRTPDGQTELLNVCGRQSVTAVRTAPGVTREV
jgi:hypothetical protein